MRLYALRPELLPTRTFELPEQKQAAPLGLTKLSPPRPEVPRSPAVNARNVSEARPEGLPLYGLRNLGNTCFAAAALQVLFRYPSVVKELRRDAKTHLVLQRLFAAAQDPGAAPAELGSVLPTFFDGDQHDAHEFLIHLLALLDEECGTESSWVKDCCGGDMTNAIVCTSCSHELLKKEPFIALSLPLPNANTTVADLMQKLTERQAADDYVCENCKAKTVTIATTITRAPEILLVHPLRFLPVLRNDEMVFVKSRVEVDITPTLSLATPNGNVTYELVGLAQHHGRYMTSGHYTALVRDAASWRQIDDTKVIPIDNASELLKGDRGAVLVGYRRCFV
jgi:ubiquitin C-terminal hydrolase